MATPVLDVRGLAHAYPDGHQALFGVDLPGMDQKDIYISLTDGMLTIKGEKQSETNGASYSERWHGRFERSLRLGPDVDPDQVNAEMKNGVLTVTAKKRPEAQRQVKRIPVRAS